MIKELWEAGKEKRLERKKQRVCFHVLSVNLAIKHIDQEKSFWNGPVTDEHLDYYFGLFAWNDWFFVEFKSKTELKPELLTFYRRGVSSA